MGVLLMGVWHYDETPLPVGVMVHMNGSNKSYQLGLYDGALYSEQYADEPDEGVLFESPEGAKRWLDAVTAVLTPYIESGDQESRIPDPSGWATEEES